MPAKAAARPRKSSRPNVIWVIADQLRAQALGLMGDPNAITPCLERFASDGVTFTNAVAGAPASVPFRNALLSGRYPRPAPAAAPPAAPAQLVTDAFNGAGYLTAWFGKWRMGNSGEDGFVPRPQRGRFRVWLGYDHGVSPNECWIHGHDLGGRDDTRAQAEKISAYEADGMTERFIGFLREFGCTKPFFVVLSLQAPHHPYIAPAEYAARYRPDAIRLRPNVPAHERTVARARADLAGYYAQIENLDWNFGRVVDALDELGLAANTHVVFLSDHGDLHGSHGGFSAGSPWEESVRIPFLVRPALGQKRAGHFADAPMNHVDIAPTTLGLCGIEPPADFEGSDFSAQILAARQSLAAAGAPAARASQASSPQFTESAYLQHIAPTVHDGFNQPWRGLRTCDGWKYVCLEGQPWALFNLNDDPYELVNLAYLDDYRERRAALQSTLAAWIERTGDTFALPVQ